MAIPIPLQAAHFQFAPGQAIAGGIHASANCKSPHSESFVLFCLSIKLKLSVIPSRMLHLQKLSAGCLSAVSSTVNDFRNY